MQFRTEVRTRKLRMSFSDLRNATPGAWATALSGEPPEVARWLDAAARYGLVEAQTLLGQLLLDGRGLPKDAAAALRWFGIAAGAGHPPAMNMVGRCHELGWGTEIDWAQAAGWYRRAAEASYDWGQYNLANLLLRGQGLACDRQEARAWYVRAANQGHAQSMNMLARFFEEGWECAPESMAAVTWYRFAAERGDYRGQYNLATYLLRDGKISEAADWFRRAVSTATSDVLQAVVLALRYATGSPLEDVRLAACARLADSGGTVDGARRRS